MKGSQSVVILKIFLLLLVQLLFRYFATGYNHYSYLNDLQKRYISRKFSIEKSCSLFMMQIYSTVSHKYINQPLMESST